MKFLLAPLLLLAMTSCSDDDSPTAPGADLVGTWIGVSTTDNATPGIEGGMWVVRADGTFTQSFEVEGVTISVEWTWEIVGANWVP